MTTRGDLDALTPARWKPVVSPTSVANPGDPRDVALVTIKRSLSSPSPPHPRHPAGRLHSKQREFFFVFKNQSRTRFAQKQPTAFGHFLGQIFRLPIRQQLPARFQFHRFTERGHDGV